MFIQENLRKFLDSEGISYNPLTRDSWIACPVDVPVSQKLIRFCYSESISWKPAGNFNNPWNSEIVQNCTYISLANSHSDFKISFADGTIECSSGITTRSFHAETKKYDTIFPYSTGLNGLHTIGGIFSSGGYNLFDGLIGSIGGNTTGIRFIDKEGKLLRFGGNIMKNVAGYDIPSFSGGSNGNTGLITSLIFKMFPFRGQVNRLMSGKINLDSAINLVKLLENSTLPLWGIIFSADNTGSFGRLSVIMHDPYGELPSFYDHFNKFSSNEGEMEELFPGNLYKNIFSPETAISVDITIPGTLNFETISTITGLIKRNYTITGCNWGIVGTVGEYHLLIGIQTADNEAEPELQEMVEKLIDYCGKELCKLNRFSVKNEIMRNTLTKFCPAEC